MHPFHLDPIQTLLCRAIADAPPVERAYAAQELLAALGEARAFDLAQRNQVAPVVAHALMDSSIGGLMPQWRAVHDKMHARISAYLAELDQVAARLADVGFATILLENGMLARAVYPCPGCFSFGDFDLLVRQEYLSLVHDVLSKRGYRFGSTIPTAALASNGRLEYATTLSNGYELRLNVQCSLVARRWFGSNQEPDLDALFARSLPIPDSVIRILSPEDNLFQLAIHNAAHGYVRKPGMRLHLDIERFVRRVDLDWTKFVELVQYHRAKTAVYFSLAIPRALFQTPIPESVLARLKPPAWKEQLVSRWLQRAGLFNPDARKFSRVGYIVFTALLYDDLSGLWRGIFPSRAWMRARYGFQSDWLLPYYHGRRLVDLALRRMGV